MKRALPVRAGIDQRCQCGVVVQLARGDGLVDSGKILKHYAAGSKVHVSDLRVSHLPGRQSDRLTAGGQEG